MPTYSEKSYSQRLTARGFRVTFISWTAHKTSHPTSPPSTLTASTWLSLKTSTTGPNTASTPPCSWIGIWTFPVWWICTRMPMVSRVAGQRCLPLTPNSAPRSMRWTRRSKVLGRWLRRRSKPMRRRLNMSGSFRASIPLLSWRRWSLRPPSPSGSFAPCE